MIIYFVTYQLIHILVFPLFLVYGIIRKLKGKPIFGNVLERFGIVPLAPLTKAVYWIHAVSVGEILSIQNFITQIKQTIPNSYCYITCGTQTGKKIALEKLDADAISFIPFDFLVPMLLGFSRIHPRVLIIVEAEIWPNLLMLAHFKKIHCYLLNARMSNKSKPKYTRFKSILAPLFAVFDHIYPQSNLDKTNIVSLGVTPEKITVLGNVKAANVLEKRAALPTPANNTRPCILLGSLHPGELDIYLNTFEKLKAKYPELQLIIAPRHFHWKAKLVDKITGHNFTYTMWDENQTADPATYTTNILLVCKLGELFGLYPHADIFCLGGTFVPIGGHNLLEPAVWAKPSIVGPYHNNCAVTADHLEVHNALIKTNNEEELYLTIDRLLDSPRIMKEMGANAYTWLEGEAEHVDHITADLLKKLLHHEE